MRVKIYLSALSMVFLAWSFSAYSQSIKPEKIMTPVGFSKLEKLSDVPPNPPGYVDRSWKERVVPNELGFEQEFQVESVWTGPDPVLQANLSSNRSAAITNQNFAGQVNTSGVAPPDTDGDVGLNHYMQMVNLTYEIFDKQGNSLYGPADNSTLWNGFTGPWTGSNDGDPIVLYDEYADRWVATQFALPNYPGGPFYELVAVSATADPLGAWYRYAYEFSNMPDYPKFGVWPDGYYMTINQFSPNSLLFAGAGVAVMDRAAMISGSSSAQIVFWSTGYASILPADADGTQPPQGNPNYLANLGTNSLRIWEVSVDWNTPNNSTLDLVRTLTTASFSTSGIVINQPGTSQTLDALSTRLMFRLQYRNFGSYQVLLTNHTVNADGNGQAGVRWYELRDEGSGWYIYQQGTYAPADGNDRWMGSIAMNGNGDIGLGYSVSSSSTYPSIRFVGQTVANSGTGIFDVDETSIKAGTTSQTGVNRWGDYSMMSIDPSDDASFWYTSEFSNGGWNWATRIASMSVQPVVVIPPVADFSASPIPVMATQPVNFTDLSSNNPTSWSWSFPGGTPSSSTAKNPTVTYDTPGDYDVTLTATNSAGSNSITKTAYIHVTTFVPSYCTSSGSNTTKEWINSVGIGSYLNVSGSDNGYGDYTSPAISLENGNSYDLALGPGFPRKSRAEYWRVWIDFNMDGDFADAGELVLTADADNNNVFGTVSIPANLEGETRMRVSMKYGSGATSCESFIYGEVEDYTLSFFTPVPQAPVADFAGTPTTVLIGNAVQFTDLSLNNPTSWTWTFTGGDIPSSTDQNPSVTYNTLGPQQVSLTVSNLQGSDTKTVAAYINVVDASTYCSSQSTSNAVEYIDRVQIANFANQSGPGLYSDFTGMTVDLVPGSTNGMTLTPHTTSQRNFWRVWIDFNGNGSFDDAGDLVYTGNNKKGPVTGSIDIPTGLSGQTRMRISMKTGSSPTSCETFTDGEVEDYTANFLAGAAPVAMKAKLSMEIFPNPASDVLNIEVSSGKEVVNIKVYNAIGQIIDEFSVASGRTTYRLNDFPKGMYYIGADDGIENTLKKFIRE